MDADAKRRIGTSGGWAGVAVGLLASAAPILWPNTMAVGYVIGAGGVVLLLCAVGWLVRREKAPERVRVPPILPIAPSMAEEPDVEINLQQAFHLICERLGITSRGGGTEEVDARLNVFRDLRQKARDASVVIRGREQPYGALMGMYKPREAIPAEHWRNMDFDAPRYIFGEGATFLEETATEPDHKEMKENPHPYVDLTVSKAAIEKAWPPRPVASSWMISVVEFLAAAEKHGWSFGPKSVDVNKLQVGLREAAVNGRVKVYGRKYTSTPSITRNEPRVPIPAEIWKTNWMILLAVLPPMNGENFDTAAQEPMSKPSYVDLHFGTEVLEWLKNDAAQYRNVKFK